MKEKRDTYIKFLVTKREKESLHYYSEVTGLSISQLIRERCKELLKGVPKECETDSLDVE